MRQQSDSAVLMKNIQAASFAVDDMRLFLDTHPFDQQAVQYFQDCQSNRNQFINEYETNFGPILSYNVDEDNHWTWVDKPWPWEGEM